MTEKLNLEKRIEKVIYLLSTQKQNISNKNVSEIMDVLNECKNLENEKNEAQKALERDRSTVISAVNKMRDEIQGREWILEGRGPYAWDDDRYREEFSDVLNYIKKPLDIMREVGRDWTNCPTESKIINKARKNSVTFN